MGVFERKDSPYWWIWLDGTSRRFSSKVPIGIGARRRDSRAEAEAIYQVAMGDLARGKFQLPQDSPAIRFRTHAEWYRDTISATHKGGRREVSIVNALIDALGDRYLHDLDAHAIEEWKARRATTHAKTSVNRELDVLKPLLASAVPKYLQANPADAVSRFSVRRLPPVTILDYDAEDQLLEHATPQERALILLGTDALLRLGDARTFHTRHDKGTYLEVPDPKTGTPYKVPCSARLRAALDAIRDAADQHGGWYFTATTKRQKGPRKGQWAAISEATAWQWFHDACARAGVPRGRKVGGVTFHSTRHTGATRAASAVKLTVVKALGGWASLRQLERYDHPDDPELVRAVSAIGSRPTHANSTENKNTRKP